MAASGKSILDTWYEKQSELGVDQITKERALALETPYSKDSGFDFDESFIDGQGGWDKVRGGVLDVTKYSETVPRV